MPTFSQLVRMGREKVLVKTKSPALAGCPEKRGVCIRVYARTPKNRTLLCKVARVRLTNSVDGEGTGSGPVPDAQGAPGVGVG